MVEKQEEKNPPMVINTIGEISNRFGNKGFASYNESLPNS